MGYWTGPFVPNRAIFGPELTSASAHSMIGPLGEPTFGQDAVLREAP
jgi:hypothetical protein